MYLIMELLTGGELLDAVLDKGSYSEADARLCFLQLLRGIHYLHSQCAAPLPVSYAVGYLCAPPPPSARDLFPPQRLCRVFRKQGWKRFSATSSRLLDCGDMGIGLSAKQCHRTTPHLEQDIQTMAGVYSHWGIPSDIISPSLVLLLWTLLKRRYKSLQ